MLEIVEITKIVKIATNILIEEATKPKIEKNV
jgi:hypothetical protein